MDPASGTSVGIILKIPGYWANSHPTWGSSSCDMKYSYLCRDFCWMGCTEFSSKLLIPGGFDMEIRHTKKWWISPWIFTIEKIEKFEDATDLFGIENFRESDQILVANSPTGRQQIYGTYKN